VADDVGSGCAVSFNIMVDAKIATMNNITLRVRKAAIVLAAVKGEALTRRPDGRPLESLSEGRLWTAAVRDGRMSFGRDEGMARALTEQRKGRRFVNLATLSIPLIGPKGLCLCDDGGDRQHPKYRLSTESADCQFMRKTSRSATT
jgi:hypothetical protein